jgi:hypothetical protein
MSAYLIEHSAELMANFIQAEVLGAERKIQAAQTRSGAALLLSISTDGALYATLEEPGKADARLGWTRTNLSQEQAAIVFGADRGAKCKDFAIAQSKDGLIQVAMVLEDGAGNDALCLSLRNSDTDLTWIKDPKWLRFPYDDPHHTRPTLQIAGVFISEASDAEYIVVDVVRDPAKNKDLFFRYYIDVTKTDDYAWHPHDVPIDIKIDEYVSCLGRRSGDRVDGIYTTGTTAAGSVQFIYVPIRNVFDPGIPPNSARLNLPGGVRPDAIAACRRSDDSSDLYVAASGALYWFASPNQEDGSTGSLVAKNDLLNKVLDLFAFVADNETVVVWGRNHANQIFYLTCPLTGLQANAAWSTPLPILSSVEQVAPFVNRAYSANCFFAHVGQNRLVKAVKSPETMVWTFREIILPPLDNKLPAEKFTSYTTRVHVTDGKGRPAVDAPVVIRAKNITSVYINHVYYVLGPAPVRVNADKAGSLTIVEKVHTVAGTELTIEAGDASSEINPMKNAVKKALKLTTPDKLKEAKIQRWDGTTKPLVPPEADDASLQAIADCNRQLQTARTAQQHLEARGPVALNAPGPAAAVDAVLVDAGDFFCWLGDEIKSGATATIRIIEIAEKEVVSATIKIGEKLFKVALENLHVLAEGLIWVYNWVKTKAEDVLTYLEYLFDVADMRRSKDVIKNVVKVGLNHMVDEIENIKNSFDQVIAVAEKGISDWAKLPGFDAAAGSIDKQKVERPARSAPASLLEHHFQGNVENWSAKSPLAHPPANQSLFDKLVAAVESEQAAISETASQLRQLLDRLSDITLGQALKEVLAIVAKLGLETAKNIVDALLDLILSMAREAVALLDTPIHIPVLSDILRHFGVPEFSFLDLGCWIAAAPATIFYKMLTGRAPFPDEPHTKTLIEAPDWPALLRALRSDGRDPVEAMDGRERLLDADFAARPPLDRTFFAIGQLSAAACCGLSAWVDSAEAIAPEVNPVAIPSSMLAVVGGVTQFTTNMAIPHFPLTAPWAVQLSRLLTFVWLGAKVIFSSSAHQVMARGPLFQTSRGLSAIAAAVIGVLQLLISGYYFYELAGRPEGGTRSVAYINETTYASSYLSRIAYAVAVNVKGPIQLGAIVAMAALIGSSAVLLGADAIVELKTST